MAAPAKSTPKDAQVMMAILKEMGVTEYEPRVINQMLEFTYGKNHTNGKIIIREKSCKILEKSGNFRQILFVTFSNI